MSYKLGNIRLSSYYTMFFFKRKSTTLLNWYHDEFKSRGEEARPRRMWAPKGKSSQRCWSVIIVVTTSNVLIHPMQMPFFSNPFFSNPLCIKLLCLCIKLL